MNTRALWTGLLLAVSPLVALAGEVKIDSVHLCCGACVRGVNEALGNVKGVTGVSCDRDAGTVSFAAADALVAKSAIEALADAGFAGVAKHNGEALALPATGAKDGATADSLTFTGVHLCCGGCVVAARKAVAKLPGVSEVEVDQDGKTVQVIGSGIDQGKVAKALLDNGFFGKLKTK